eukprot:1150287-Pelagomonas_calceolata.AAC.7
MEGKVVRKRFSMCIWEGKRSSLLLKSEWEATWRYKKDASSRSTCICCVNVTQLYGDSYPSA